MKIRIYRDVKYHKIIEVEEDSLETAKKMKSQGEYELLWESTQFTDCIEDTTSFIKCQEPETEESF